METTALRFKQTAIGSSSSSSQSQPPYYRDVWERERSSFSTTWNNNININTSLSSGGPGAAADVRGMGGHPYYVPPTLFHQQTVASSSSNGISRYAQGSPKRHGGSDHLVSNAAPPPPPPQSAAGAAAMMINNVSSNRKTSPHAPPLHNYFVPTSSTSSSASLLYRRPTIASTNSNAADHRKGLHSPATVPSSSPPAANLKSNLGRRLMAPSFMSTPVKGKPASGMCTPGKSTQEPAYQQQLHHVYAVEALPPQDDDEDENRDVVASPIRSVREGSDKGDEPSSMVSYMWSDVVGIPPSVTGTPLMPSQADRDPGGGGGSVTRRPPPPLPPALTGPIRPPPPPPLPALSPLRSQRVPAAYEDITTPTAGSSLLSTTNDETISQTKLSQTKRDMEDTVVSYATRNDAIDISAPISTPSASPQRLIVANDDDDDNDDKNTSSSAPVLRAAIAVVMCRRESSDRQAMESRELFELDEVCGRLQVSLERCKMSSYERRARDSIQELEKRVFELWFREWLALSAAAASRRPRIAKEASLPSTKEQPLSQPTDHHLLELSTTNGDKTVERGTSESQDHRVAVSDLSPQRPDDEPLSDEEEEEEQEEVVDAVVVALPDDVERAAQHRHPYEMENFVSAHMPTNLHSSRRTPDEAATKMQPANNTYNTSKSTVSLAMQQQRNKKQHRQISTKSIIASKVFATTSTTNGNINMSSGSGSNNTTAQLFDGTTTSSTTTKPLDVVQYLMNLELPLSGGANNNNNNNNKHQMTERGGRVQPFSAVVVHPVRSTLLTMRSSSAQAVDADVPSTTSLSSSVPMSVNQYVTAKQPNMQTNRRLKSDSACIASLEAEIATLHGVHVVPAATVSAAPPPTATTPAAAVNIAHAQGPSRVMIKTVAPPQPPRPAEVAPLDNHSSKKSIAKTTSTASVSDPRLVTTTTNTATTVVVPPPEAPLNHNHHMAPLVESSSSSSSLSSLSVDEEEDAEVQENEE